MFAQKLSLPILISALVISSGLVAGVQTITRAQGGTPGLTIFSGVDRENLLNYHLDFGGVSDGWDRYRLFIPAKKMTQGASKFFISYPEYYDGKFNPDKIEVRLKDKKVPLRSVNWDKESRIVEIDLAEPIKRSEKVELVFSDVKNPASGGTYYFNAQLLAAGDIPIRQHVGTWILTIDR